ncbi:hypothetical protein Ciccas_001775 [Cichlidogyrus casuarinus]|uniref:Vitellogenin n=1 Tax=Cichlidogyrus casuarinus TaxID=1844966 RepID=A0ABD2QJE3_9PLAT
MHLSPVHQSESQQEACSLMDHLYAPDVHFRLPENEVKSMILKFSSQLKMDEFGSIGYENAALELVKIMRCFPHTESTINFFSNTLELTHSNLIENSFFLKSWKASLIDVFINCGTELCLDLLTSLIDSLSSLLMQYAQNPAISSLKQYFKTQVWISLGFVRKPSSHFVKKLDEICTELEKYKELQSDWYSCFNLLSIMHEKNPNFVPKIEEKLLELLAKNKDPSESNYNERIVFAFLSVSKFQPKDPKLFRTIFEDFVIKKDTPLPIRAVALHSLIKSKNLTYSAKIVDLILEKKLPELLNAFAFSLLIQQDELVSAPLLLFIFQQLVQQKRFNVIASGRRALRMACLKERIEMAKCKCIENGGWFDELGFQCRPGFAASWSGLAFKNASFSANHGVLVNQTHLLSDYNSVTLNDEEGNLLYTINQANLVTEEGETKLGEVDLILDPEQGWMMVVFELLGMRIVPVSLPVSAMDGLAWIMTESERKTRAKFDRLAIDSRAYLTVASQWPVTVDMRAILSLELESSFEIVSLWSQQGTMNLNSKVGFLFDGQLRINDSLLNFGVSTQTGLSYAITSDPEKISNGLACSSLKTSKQSLARTWVDPVAKRVDNFLAKVKNAAAKSEFSRKTANFQYQSTNIPLGARNEEMCSILNKS